MSIDSIISNALSGLNAAWQRLEVSAANVANADSVGALPGSASDSGAPQAYTPFRVVQEPLPSGGTFTTIVPIDPRLVRRIVPDSPAANPDGIVATPDVDLVSEGIEQLAATNAYEANLRILQAAQALAEESAAVLGAKRHDLSA
jgi:flagellar basal-body rod protein FlgC